jgi:hypothetical protein
VLHLWSSERNAVRRVVDAEVKDGALRLAVLRFGQSKPGKLEICRERDQRSPTQRRASRNLYQRKLRAVLEREFRGFTIERLTCNMDLERSFSPVYTRGLLQQGSHAFALLGVNAEEPQSAIDASLTFGILWLDYCRERSVQTRGSLCHIQGLKLFVPAGAGAVVRERMAHMNHFAARWQLYELNERDGTLAELDTADRGNVVTRLVHCPDRAAALERFAGSIREVRELVPDTDVVVISAGEVAFRWLGLEFGRARMEPEAGSLRLTEQLVFGTGPNETPLTDETRPQLTELVRQAAAIRQADGPRAHALWRMAPERWLESAVMRDISAVDERLERNCVYSQVPAFAASDRAMIDVLGITGEGRLAVLELKADEDIHLPLQGIDYWARVEWHRARKEFQQFGYFPGRQLSLEPAILLLVAPALHVHPATDTLLRYLAPEIDCRLVGIDEHWREGVRVIFRKRISQAKTAAQ